jgi:hypothetical protein
MARSLFPIIRRISIFLSTLLILLPSPLHALDTGQIEKRIFDLVNAERARRNLPPCAHSPELASLARLHSRNMVRHRFFSHTDHERRSPLDRKLAHFPGLFGSIGENIAYHSGQTEEEAARNLMRSWMDSPGHRANVLSDQFTHLGVGVVEGGEQVYATQSFSELVAVLEGDVPRRVPFGSELTLKFRFLGRFEKKRLTVFVHFPDRAAKVFVSKDRYYTGAGPYQPIWEGDRFTVKVLCNKGRGTYNLTMGKDGSFDPEGLRFEVR